MVDVPTRTLLDYLNSLPSGGTGGVVTRDLTIRGDIPTAGQAVPPGGSTGEVLVKLSGDDFNTGWSPAGTGTVKTVSSISALKALPISEGAAILSQDGHLGTFIWSAGDFSGVVSADPQETIYIESDLEPSSDGAWVRSLGLTGLDTPTTNLFSIPEVNAQVVGGITGLPTGYTNYFNVAVSPGSNILETTNSRRNSLFGLSVGQSVSEWERVEAYGNGAMRFSEFAQRVSAVGSISYQWGGSTSKQHLIDTLHDFWREDTPGSPTWDFMGLETRNPGIGAAIEAFSSYAASTSDFAYNIGLGRDSGLHVVVGTNLNFLGYQAGANAFSATSLVGVGREALRDSVFLTESVGIGNYAGNYWQEGTRNLVLGHNSGPTVVKGSNNTIVGPYSSNGPTQVDNSVLIGYQSGIGDGSTLSEVLAIQRGAARKPLISGKFDTGRVGINSYASGLSSIFHVFDFSGVERFRTGEGNGISRFLYTDAGAGAGPIVILDRVSESPSASDIIGTTRYYGRDSAGNEINYADIYAAILDPTDTSEDGELVLRSTVAGSIGVRIRIGNGVQIGAPTSGYMGAGTLNMDNAIYRDGVQVVGARQTGWSAPTGTATKTTFDTSTVTLPDLAERVKALIDDLTTHGLIGA